MHARAVIRCLLVIALSASACTTSSGGDAGLDPGLFPCPLAEPSESSSCTSAGPWCVYGARQCRCNGGIPGWSCESSMCPTTPIQTGSPCNTPGLSCDPGLESSCVCLNREHTWFCCSAGVLCPGHYVEDGLCCGLPDGCPFVDGGVTVTPRCIDNHWHITTTETDAGHD